MNKITNAIAKMFGSKVQEQDIIAHFAHLIKTSPEAMKAFEESYEKYVLDASVSDNLFKISAKQAARMNASSKHLSKDLLQRLTDEVLTQCSTWSYDRETDTINIVHKQDLPSQPVMADELKALDITHRPLFSATLAQTDYGSDISATAASYVQWQNATGKAKQIAYGQFRQGLDILDLNPLSYEMLNTNPNSMGYWLPAMVDSVRNDNFFKIPSTTILRMPITMAQMPHLAFETMTRATKDLINAVCTRAFNLKPDGDYFVKTGTYSSKFDFRNARVTTPNEVAELGEYLLFIHYQALCMAHYDILNRNQPVIYGVSSTNDWVCREFIPDVEGNAVMYHGMPLRTEYRLFVDFDTKEILGMSPYWEPDTIRRNLREKVQMQDVDAIHDLITFESNVEAMTARYEANKDLVAKHVLNIAQLNQTLQGQWSIDIMQNGADFWFIDMASAHDSALNECVPAGKLKPLDHNWVPKLGQ